MDALTGIALILFGGLASASYYLPLKYVKSWSWESGWMIQGIAAWVIGPWLMAIITLPHLGTIIGSSPASSIVWPVIFGFGWGIGGLTWGLSIRYLGIGLGNALPLGLTSALSTVLSPIVPILIGQTEAPDGIGAAVSEQLSLMFSGTGGSILASSIILSLLGIAVCGYAASLKEKDLNKAGNSSGFDLKKGLLVALVAGVMSACFAFGEASGKAMADITANLNPGTIWKYNAVYAVLLIGGFIFNMAYCGYQSVKQKTYSDFGNSASPLKLNYIFALMAGFVWFTQFLFKGVGSTKIPAELNFISWTILFSSVIVFGNLIGIATKEWKGVTAKTISVLILGLLLLVGSVALVGLATR
jgi:L-rhamnose-H+ transport protein